MSVTADALIISVLPDVLKPLHYRCDCGIEVELSWSPADNTIWLAYRDIREPEMSFITKLGNNEHALDAFWHPNDYRREALISNFA